MHDFSKFCLLIVFTYPTGWSETVAVWGLAAHWFLIHNRCSLENYIIVAYAIY